MQRLQGAELLGNGERRVVGQHDAPAPSRMVCVLAATWAISTLVAEEPIDDMLWCSAYHTRR
jgi:hypothetical protein